MIKYIYAVWYASSYWLGLRGRAREPEVHLPVCHKTRFLPKDDIYPWDKLSWYDELSKYISMLMKFRA